MIQYIYFVKCPNCEDEHFDFFDEAKEFALGCLSQKPIITQTEVDRNDFGECTDSCDLGTVWSWEDAMGKETDAEPAISVFTKDDLKCIADGKDPEFDELDNSVDCEIAEISDRKPIPEGMTIEQLVEEMEENEDTVECAGCEELFPKGDCTFSKEIGWLCPDCVDRVVLCNWCDELFDKSECRYEVDLGWLCSRCEMAIKSRGETLTFREGNYWDFLDEAATKPEWRKAGPKLFKLATSKGTAEVYQNTHGIFELTVKDKSGKYVVGGGVRVGGSTVPEDETHKTKMAAMKTAEKYLVEDFLDESVNEATRTLAELVKDSINHLTNDLGKDPWADGFADDVIADIEKNYDTYVPENIEQYNHWCSAVAGEVSRQVNSDYKLTDEVEPEELHDLGNTYDGGYPEDSKLAELEEATDYRKRLDLCPECGAEQAFDHETGICLECGFNI